ncbi:hypothetical protein [Caldisericum sp.]|uniref:hypothetical protein n=1 Tax=Caldisericum sp. TaxID=2499687 RepID=UPI003D0E6CB0
MMPVFLSKFKPWLTKQDALIKLRLSATSKMFGNVMLNILVFLIDTADSSRIPTSVSPTLNLLFHITYQFFLFTNF